MTAAPDFIIIGGMKCATSTLHEQLNAQPGIFMTTPKEPCYFSDDAQWRRGATWYQSLFDGAAEGDLTGESSTHYTKLPTHAHTIERMQQLPDHTKFIYIVRHPIDRLVSHYIHEWTQRVIDCSIGEAIERHPELIAYGRYAMQLEPYLEAFGRARVQVIFFEHFTAEPQRELERTCRFIGYRRDPRWQDDFSQRNVSSERLRASGLRDAIVNLPGMTALRRTLLPKGVRDRIRNLWTMKERPELSDAQRDRLERIFNDDLRSFGEWFGLPLTCTSFKEIAWRTEPEWQQSVVGVA